MLTFLDYATQIVLANKPRPVCELLVYQSDALDFWIDCIQSEENPLKRPTRQNKLFVQKDEQIFTFVTGHGHDCEVVVNVLGKDIVLDRAGVSGLTSVVVVHEEQLRPINVEHVGGKPRQQAVVAVDTTVN